ncbi:hypothetical protein Pyn_27912 [Prunus yedoensis var. nudiflora]|uniref:Uncharacterized protein n=1 Tax=Prunus yedoensis var. nudiflora TaxID=2094558 RepID=A0A314ZEG1_PRUYE|nr:hypothetical protein Pyn_27912 [Prunus yedoensis var. nudiflora]
MSPLRPFWVAYRKAVELCRQSICIGALLPLDLDANDFIRGSSIQGLTKDKIFEVLRGRCFLCNLNIVFFWMKRSRVCYR